MKKVLIFTAVLLLHFSYSTEKLNGQTKSDAFYEEYASDATGKLFIIGGGTRPDYLMQRFIDLAGEGEKNVLIIPYASTTPESSGMKEKENFLRLGVTSCDILLSEKKDLDNQENLDKIKNANLIYFPGGGQTRLVNYLKGTMLFNRIKSFYTEGGIVGGTSAGAAIMSKIMIDGKTKPVEPGKERFSSLIRNFWITRDGFGFMENVVIDQHFLERKRHNRLISVLLDNPRTRGFGIDESTAIIVRPDNTCEIVGESKVVVYEPNNSLTDPGVAPAFIVRILSDGDIYEL